MEKKKLSDRYAFPVLNMVRRQLRADNEINRTEISDYLGCAFSTVTKVMSDLKDENFLLSDGNDYKVNSKKEHFVGISIGSSTFIVSIIDLNFKVDREAILRFGEKLQEESSLTSYDSLYIPDSIYDSIEIKMDGVTTTIPDNLFALMILINKCIVALLEDSELNITAIGLSFSGIVDEEKREVIENCSIPYIKNSKIDTLLLPNLLEKIEKKGIRISFIHHARAVAIAEKEIRYKSIDDEKNAACVYIGTGIGAGLILDNKLYRGDKNGAGQVGHMKLPFALNGEAAENFGLCGCGKHGCIEQLIRAQVFEQKKFKPINDKEEEISETTELSTELSQEKKAIFAKYIAIILSNLVHSIDVGIIVITGRLAHLCKGIWLELTANLKDLCSFGLDRHYKLLLSENGECLPAIGSAINAYFYCYDCEVSW